MKINMDTGTLVIIGVIVLFYLRVFLIQRGKSRRAKLLAGKSHRAIKKAIAKGKIDASVPKQGIQIVSWYLVFASILIILFGFILHSTDWPIKDWIVKDWWWVIISAGIAILGFSIY
jgi:hypothetical protein